MANFGMMWTQSQAANLQSDLTSIYEGVTGNSYKACNLVHSYQHDWGQGGLGHWLDWQFLLQKANAAAGVGNLKCLIGDLSFATASQSGWYLNSSNQVQIPYLNDLVNYICQNTTADERSAILGWYLADEPGTHSQRIVNLSSYTTIVNTVHQRQQSHGKNWPFYVAFAVYAMWKPNQTDLDLQQYMDPWVNAVNCAGANIVIMLDYYPWLMISGEFAYSESPPQKWNPLKKWKKFVDDVKNRYPTKPVDVILQAHHYNGCPSQVPGHADMHQQIRAMLNYTNVHDIWFIGWGPGYQYASARWTQSNTEQYAEAIERERNTASESLSKPSNNQLYQNYPNPFSTGTWIPYALKERKKVSFVIKNVGGQTVRNLDLGYNYNSVEGWYQNNPNNQINKLYGTAGYWDAKNNNGEIVGAGTYYCTMYVDGTQVETKSMVKQ